MDKSRFIELAPLYYALAIRVALKKKAGGKALSLPGIIDIYSYHDEDDPTEPIKLLQYYPLINRAVDLLRAHGLIEVIEDDFGSALFEDKPPSWGRDTPAILEDPDLPFYKYEKASNGDDWLEDALSAVNLKWSELGINVGDFANPDAEWEPLPLERTDPALQRAVEAIDATLKQVREDNGYNATVPEERNYVVASLSTASQVLKSENTTSIPFVRQYILEPLSKVARRFGGAALGAVAAGARAAVIEYVKQHAPEWVAALIRLL